jgi:hypothetical protein
MPSVFLPCSINQQISLAPSSFGNPFTNLMWLQSVRVRCPLTVLLTITSSQVGCRSVLRPSFFVRKLYLGHRVSSLNTTGFRSTLVGAHVSLAISSILQESRILSSFCSVSSPDSLAVLSLVTPEFVPAAKDKPG